MKTIVVCSIKACLEIEKTQAVCCSHPPNIYFLLNSNKSFTVLLHFYGRGHENNSAAITNS